MAALDAAIFPRYRELYVDVLSEVMPDPANLDAQKRAFLNDELTNPVFTYEKNLTLDHDDTEAALHKLAAEARAPGVYLDPVARAYEGAIAERLMQVQLGRSIQQLQRDADTERFTERFTEAMGSLYGMPEQSIFDDLLAALVGELRAMPLECESNAARERLLDLMGDRERTFTPPVMEPPSDIVNPTNPITTSAELVAIFEEALTHLGIDDWKIVVSAYTSNIRVLPKVRHVWVPSDQDLAVRAKPLTHSNVLGLVTHEIGTHVLRQHQGQKSCLQLLAFGFNGYQRGEEGLAMYREQQFTGVVDFAGVEGYLAIGLARGLDGAGMRTFREVFEVLVDHFMAIRGFPQEASRELAWKRCVRTFRGTPGYLPGVVFTKDIVYRDGNIATWREMCDGTYHDLDLDAGKYDQTDPTQRSIIRELVELVG